MAWAARIKIAIGSAKGLAYLHEDCQPKIIHHDIKASNILLDDNFEAKIPSSRYVASGKLTYKSDVFSFGVVLLELITGRKPVDKIESFPDDRMVMWVLVTAVAVGLVAHYVCGLPGPASIVIGNGLALSSTAVVLQDLAVVVLLILIPLISPNSSK